GAFVDQAAGREQSDDEVVRPAPNRRRDHGVDALTLADSDGPVDPQPAVMLPQQLQHAFAGPVLSEGVQSSFTPDHLHGGFAPLRESSRAISGTAANCSLSMRGYTAVRSTCPAAYLR